MPIPNKPVVLVILDGWGIAPPSRGNPITVARTPTMDSLIDSFPTMTLQASGEAVGLPWGEMGNSEVGHLNLGAGRIVYQNLPRISKAISDGSFFANEAFIKAAKNCTDLNSQMHLIGLTSTGGVHSSLDHLFALLSFCQQQKLKKVFIHAILDGRDTPPQSGINFMTKLQERIKALKTGKIATISGRYYAMDRDNRWDREEKAYKAMALGEADRTGTDPLAILEKSYKEGNLDEEFIPTVILEKGKPVTKISEKDSIIFFNFRPDRARQLTTAFVLPGFEKFERPHYLRDIFFVTMTEYDKDIPVVVAFPPENIAVPLGKVVSSAGLKQLHIAETEKYAHVTYFFNGGREEPFPGQENALIPSPSVSSYDQKPEMSAVELTDRLIKEVNKGKFDFVVINYANADMVAHTGNISATVQAVETIDQCLNKIIKTVLPLNGLVFITADHGNAEELLNLQTATMDKEHSVNPVPFIAVSENWRGQTLYKDMIIEHDLSMLQPTGILSDVTVTLLEYMGLKPPVEMTGHNLLT